MITTATASQKSLSQYIEMYQMLIDFELDKLWVQVQLKFNKSDSDQMFDDLNDKLIQVCDKYLQENKMSMDKFALATLSMRLFTQAASECEAPFKVIVKENKALMQEYLDKNKKKRETLERIKKENKELDKRIEKEEKLKAEKVTLPQQTVQTFSQTPPSPVQTISQPTNGKKEFKWDAYSLATKFTF